MPVPQAQPAARARLSAEDRRRQLIGIGLRLLVTRPIHELAIDEVAAEAGISRGLLFHYFPTKRDYYVAVVRAAARRLLKYAQDPQTGTPRERVHAAVAGYVGYVQRHRDNYVALVRSAAGGDQMVLEIFEETRRVLAERVVGAADLEPATPLTMLTVRGWLAMAEEMAVDGSEDVIAADDLIELLVETFFRVVMRLDS